MYDATTTCMDHAYSTKLVDRINCSISLFRSSVYVDIVLYFAILLPANGVVDLLKEILVFYFIVYLSF